jgi:hypothetical protein
MKDEGKEIYKKIFLFNIVFARSCNFNLFSRIKKKKTLPGIYNMKTVKINKKEIL